MPAGDARGRAVHLKSDHAETLAPLISFALPDVGTRIDVAGLPGVRQRQAAIVAARVTLDDPNLATTFGAGPQRKLSGFIDQLVTVIGAADLAATAALGRDLALLLTQIGLDGLQREAARRRNPLASLPIIGRIVSARARLQANTPQWLQQVTDMQQRAAALSDKLTHNGILLERLLAGAEANFLELQMWVAAGQQALVRLCGEFEAGRQAIGDAPAPASLRRASEQVPLFAARLTRMQLGFTAGLATLPQIRAAQASRPEVIEVTAEMAAALAELKASIAAAATGELATLAELASRITAATATAARIDDAPAQAAAARQLGELRQLVLEAQWTPMDYAAPPPMPALHRPTVND